MRSSLPATAKQKTRLLIQDALDRPTGQRAQSTSARVQTLNIDSTPPHPHLTHDSECLMIRLENPDGHHHQFG